MISLSYCNKLLDTGFNLITAEKSKKPIGVWKKYQTEKISKQEFEQRYNLPNVGKIGICTGFWDVEVIDIDLKILPSLKGQQDFWNEYTTFLRESILDFDKKVVIYKTLSGGYHILYRCKKIGGNEKIARLKEYKEAIIETRGIGGYVVIYEDQVSELAYHNIKEISELDRDNIINCSKYFDYIEPTNIPVEEKKYNTNNDLIGVKPGEDYNEKMNIWDVVRDEFTIVKHLSDRTIIRRIGSQNDSSGSIFNTNRMYLFTTGTLYPNKTLLSPFACYTYKNHNGNFSEASKDLYQKGYGSRVIKKPTELEEIIEKPTLEKIDFPIEVFPTEIQNYILQCAKTLDSSIDYMGASFLWMVSVIVGNSVKVEVKKGWIENSTVWISCVGKAGIGKTPSINNVIFPLKRINNKEIKNYIKQKEKYDAYEKLDKKEKEVAEVIKEPIKTQFIVNDVTLEALVELHEENKNSIGVFKDELAGFFKDMNKYRQGSDLEFWLSSWSNQGVSVNRKTAKSSFVESPIIPILGGIQPSILTQFFTEENKDNGFIDRILLVFPELEIELYNNREMEESIITWYGDFITEFYNTVKKALIITNEDNEIVSHVARFDNEAKIEWIRIFNVITNYQNSEEETEYFKSMYPKLKSYIPRFALLINTLESVMYGTDYTLITKESILKAELLANYFINQAKKIKFDNIDKIEAKKVIKANESKTKKEQAIEIFKANPSFKKSEIAEMLGISKQLINHYLK